MRVRLRLVWLGLGRGRAKVLLQDGQIRQIASAVDTEVGEEGGEGRVWPAAGSHAVGLGQGVLREVGEAQDERREWEHFFKQNQTCASSAGSCSLQNKGWTACSASVDQQTCSVRRAMEQVCWQPRFVLPTHAPPSAPSILLLCRRIKRACRPASSGASRHDLGLCWRQTGHSR